jgi:serine phosphatase RsbU (regulator of sigma subunit)
MELTDLCRFLRDQHMHYRGPDVEAVQKELRDSRSLLVQELHRDFGRVVVLDLADGVTSTGAFDIELFLRAAWKQMAAALGHYHEEGAFHPEQIAQLLKSEEPLLFCFLSVNLLSEDDVHRLRGLGFSQENHRILFVGACPALQKMAYPVVSSEPEGGARFPLGRFREHVGAIETDSEAVDFGGSSRGGNTTSLSTSPPPATFSPRERDPALATAPETETEPLEGVSVEPRESGTLVVIKGSQAGTVFELSGKRMVIGRHPSCQIVLDNAAVSRNHSLILQDGGTYFIEDLRSRNGTLLNSKKILGRTPLSDRDEIRICEVVLRFHQGLRPDSAALPAGPGGTAGRAAFGEAPGVPVATADFAAHLRSVRHRAPLLDDSSSDSSSIISSFDVRNPAPRLAVRPEDKLRAVMEISQNLARALQIGDVLPRILESLFRIFPQAESGFIVIKDAASGKLQVQSSRTRRHDAAESRRLSLAILRQAMDKARALLSAEAASDSRSTLAQGAGAHQVRSVMCAPLMAQSGAALGAIQIDSFDLRRPFSDDDLDVLASVATQAAVALENAQVHSAAIQQHQHDSDSAFATQLQMGFVPSQLPQASGYEFFDFYETARRVGGDFVDYLSLPDGRIAVSVGDVAGKGAQAALLMARVCSDARTRLLTIPSPAEALFSLHQSVVASGPGDPFVTMLLAVLDPPAHRVTFVNAGHLPPLLRRAGGKVEQIGADACGMPLGVATDVRFVEKTIDVARGELLVLYSDGLTEAMNPDNQVYGLQRLAQVVAREGTSARSAVEAVVADVDQFCDSTPPRDDIFIVTFQRLVN